MSDKSSLVDVNPGFWVQSGPAEIAQALINKAMLFGGCYAVIKNVQGFGRLEGVRAIYEPMLEMEPGAIYCPSIGRAILLVIAVHDEGRRGGRVLIRNVVIEGALIEGPGRVSRQLGITRPKITGRAIWLDDHTFRVILD